MKEEHRSLESLKKFKFYGSPILDLCDTALPVELASELGVGHWIVCCKNFKMVCFRYVLGEIRTEKVSWVSESDGIWTGWSQEN